MAGMYPDNQELDIFGEKVQWPGVDSSGKFSNGSFKNPLEKPSFIPAETINLILDNLSELITKLGGTPDNTSTDQLAKLINMASQGDYTDEHPAQGVGLVKTVNRWPNAQECQKNEPWAASPNWVYNLLLGNAAENEVNNVVSQALRARVGVNDLSDKSFQFRGVISKDDLDNTVVQGSYAVTAQGYSGALLVFETHSSTGIVQFYKDGFQNEPWKYRHATDSDTQRWSEWMPFGIDLTTGTQGFFKNIAINIFLKYTCATTENTDEGVLPPPNIEGFRWRFIGLGGGYGPHASVSFWRFELA